MRYFRTRILCRILESYQGIIIYGTGKYAQLIYPRLVEYGLKDNVLCFTQTDKKAENVIDGIPVIESQHLNYSKKDCAVLVAVSEIYEQEIKQWLTENHYKNIILLSDYEIYPQKAEMLLRNADDFEEYAGIISDWYIETQNDNPANDSVLETLVDRGSHIGRDSGLIVIVCGHLSIRTNKLVEALEKRNYKIVLLDYCIKRNIWYLDELGKMSVTIHQCECVEEMLYWALQYDPLVYLFQPRWSDCTWAEIMLCQKRHFGKIVISLYDVMNDGYSNVEQERLRTEKYALENADGIIWRWFSKDYLEKKGFHFLGKSKQFLDYCNHRENELQIKKNGSKLVKLCEVAGEGAEFVDLSFQTDYVYFARVYQILEKLGNRPDCIFHFYGGNLTEEYRVQCREYEKRYKNFRFFENVEHNELIHRLEEYDYGCNFFTPGEWPSDETAIGRYKGSLLKNSVRNIIFDYLSAGIPVIATVPQRLINYLQPYNVVVNMDLSDIDMPYLKENRDFYRENAKKALMELDIDKQISSLIDFINEL